MADRVLLALTSTSGSTSGGAPACLLEHDGRAVVAELTARLQQDGEVAVVTWERWRDAVRAVLPASTVVHGVRSHADAVRAVLAVAPRDLVLAHAHLVANDLALGRVTDAAARGTAAVVGVRDVRDGTPVRVTRGRVVAAASRYHEIEHASGTVLRVLRIGAADRARADARLVELADLLDRWAPASDVVGVESELVGVESDAVGVESDAVGVESDAVGVESDAVGVESDDDLVALALVALVRGGVAVAATAPPAGSVWTHPRTRQALTAATTAVAGLDEERQRLDAAVKSDDGFFTTFFVSSYSRYWARWAARRGLTPNQVTSVSMALGIAAAFAFAVGNRPWALVGAVVLQLAFTLDCVDGQLARYSRQFSALGAWLDSVFDRGKEYVVYAGLAVGGVRAGDDAELWLLAGAALALQTFRHTLDLGYAEQQFADIDAAVRQPLAPAAERGPSFWEATPVGATPVGATPVGATPATATSATSLPRRVIGLLRRVEDVGVLRWAKRIVVLPIGERFALISLVAVVWGPRAVFVALLVWGGIATAYTAGGRVVRSLA